MRRLAVLLVLLCALAAPAAAVAQGGAFGPLPPATSPSPTPSPEPEGLDDGNLSLTLLFAIGGGVILIFFGIGFYISRDARRNLTEHDRRALDNADRPRTEAEKTRSERARKKARQKTRAQKQARKKQRR